MTLWGYRLACKNCSVPLLLPIAKHGQIPQNRLLPTGVFPKNILCPACNHVCAYRFENFHPKLVPQEDQTLCRPHRVVFRAEVPCDNEGCESLIKILAVADVDSNNSMENAQQMVAISLIGATLERIACPKGHDWVIQPQNTKVREESEWM